MSVAALPACEPRLLLDIVNGDRAVFCSLADLLKRETLLRFDALVAAATAGDARAMGFAAHSLKGTVGTVGAARASAQLLALEHAGLREGRVCDAEAQASLRLELQAIRDEVDDFLRRLCVAAH